MDLIALVLVLCVIGVVVWLLTTKLPLPPGWGSAIQIVALVIVLIWILTHFLALPNVLPSR